MGSPRALAPFVALSLVVLLACLTRTYRIDDWHYAVTGSHALFGAHPWDVYRHHPAVQIGPLALVVAGVLHGAFGSAASGIACALIAISYGPLVFAAYRLAPERAGADARVRATALVAAALGIPAWLALSDSRHVDDALAVWLTIGALHAVLRGRPALVATLLVLATAATPSAIVLAPLLLTAPAPRAAKLRAATGFAVATAIIWLPFVIANGNGGAVHHVVYLTPSSSPWHLLGLGDPLPAWVRGLQVLAAIGAGCAARRSPVAVVLAAEGVRVALDPGQWPYHFAAVAVAAIALDVIRSAGVDDGPPRALRSQLPMLRLLPAVPVTAVPIAAVVAVLALAAPSQDLASIVLLALAVGAVVWSRRIAVPATAAPT